MSLYITVSLPFVIGEECEYIKLKLFLHKEGCQMEAYSAEVASQDPIWFKPRQDKGVS